MKRYHVHSKHGTGTAIDYRTAAAMRAAIGGHLTETEPEPETEPVYTCPGCGSNQSGFESYLGTLGTVRHHVCRYCGIGFTESNGVAS
jgi:rubredoxin